MKRNKTQKQKHKNKNIISKIRTENNKNIKKKNIIRIQ